MQALVLKQLRFRFKLRLKVNIYKWLVELKNYKPPYVRMVRQIEPGVYEEIIPPENHYKFIL